MSDATNAHLTESVDAFDNRIGYRLIDFGEVGLPVYRITAELLVLTARPIGPVDEFVLRAIELEINSPADIASLLGLSEAVVFATLGEMLRSEMIVLRKTESQGTSVFLTTKGKDVAQELRTEQLKEVTYSFIFDGLARRPRYYGQLPLLKPSELKQAGIFPVPAMPSKKPSQNDILVPELNAYLGADRFAGETPIASIVRVKSLRWRQLLYIKALLLLYRSTTGGELDVSFAIEGRMSPEHEKSFRKNDGISRCSFLAKVIESKETPSEDVLAARSELGPILASGDALIKESRQVLKLGVKEDKRDTEPGLQVVEGVAVGVPKTARSKVAVDLLTVYEHPKILQYALENSSKRLLIISPWIRSRVVDHAFLKQVEALLRKGVNVHIGYGIGPDEQEFSSDMRAIEKLKQFSSVYTAHMVFKRLGNTHAKVLVKDSELFVVTSFNWLSFLGDPDKTFREEWGTIVRITAKVDEYYETLLGRFS